MLKSGGALHVTCSTPPVFTPAIMDGLKETSDTNGRDTATDSVNNGSTAVIYPGVILERKW